MPAQRLKGSRTVLSRFDLIGQDSENAPSTVRHVGLAAEDSLEFQVGEVVKVAQMGPPLEREGEVEAHVLGSAGLTADETVQLKLFVDEHTSEHEARNLTMGHGIPRGYIIHPHAAPFREADGTRTYQRFSCAGFAIEAYRDAGIDFIRTDESRLPMVTLGLLKSIYPDLENPTWPAFNRRYKWGLDGNGPWPVVLPSYLFHALNRPAEQLRAGPYEPGVGDERFE